MARRRAGSPDSPRISQASVFRAAGVGWDLGRPREVPTRRIGPGVPARMPGISQQESRRPAEIEQGRLFPPETGDREGLREAPAVASVGSERVMKNSG
jgi:hypothetical protein